MSIRETVGRVDPFSPSRRPLYEVKANLFKGLAHPVRVRILEVLSAADRDGGRDVAVGDLLADTRLEASHLSQHLAVLRKHQLVIADRRGSQVFYRLAYPGVADLLAVAKALLIDILEHTEEQLRSTVEGPE